MVELFAIHGCLCEFCLSQWSPGWGWSPGWLTFVFEDEVIQPERFPFPCSFLRYSLKHHLTISSWFSPLLPTPCPFKFCTFERHTFVVCLCCLIWYQYYYPTRAPCVERFSCVNKSSCHAFTFCSVNGLDSGFWRFLYDPARCFGLLHQKLLTDIPVQKNWLGLFFKFMHFAVKVGLHTFFPVICVSLCFLNEESIVKVITIKLFGLYNCGTYLVFWQFFPEHSGRFYVSSCL